MKTSIASLFCLLALTVAATAQETTYSADSLMSAFDRKASIKGADITVRDVVTDNRSSRVTFRSSDFSRVICQLDPASASRIKQPAIGSTVTVSGKVRGRGLLGNVTLDNCGLVIHEEKAEVPAEPVAQETAVAPPEIIAETPPPALSPLEEPADQPEEAAKPAAATSKPRTASPAAKNKNVAPPPKLAQMDMPAKENPAVHTGVPYGFYALLILGGAVASSIFSRLATAVRSAKSSRPRPIENTAEIRQAALQKLLSKADKTMSSR